MRSPDSSEDLRALGLEIGRSGEALETVETKSMVLRLLVSGSMEVVEGSLALGERITLLPPTSEGLDAVESYYLLAGKLAFEDAPDARMLGPGDYLVTRGLREESILTAVEEVRFLYITSRPFFHEISSGLQELMRLAVEVELKDGYTAGHCLRLQKLSFATGRELGLSSHQLHLLDHGAYLHDVGKVKVPLEILQKPTSLTAAEWAWIKRHPTFGREMLEPTFVRGSGAIVEQHHERLDGSGYPFGLSGDEILTESYIVAIVDAYDAMTTDRTYRKALPAGEAESELQRYAGIHYPKELVTAFLAARPGVEDARGTL
jgi:HD-GYP domain-containing protein (c-di-GMP phosphodiesterase class II)